MAEALKTFREGEDILASETNDNNQYLLSKLTDNAAQVQAYVEGEVATIKSNVASVQATLQNNITTMFNLNALYITLTINENDWVKEYFSDEEKTTRVWMEMGGTTPYSVSTNTLTFPKKFASEKYSFNATPVNHIENGVVVSVHCSNKTATSIVLYGRRISSIGYAAACGQVSWYACGA